MKAPRGPRLSLPKHDDGGSRTPYVVALTLQIVVIVLVFSLVSVPLIYLVRREYGTAPVAERVTYVHQEPVPVRPVVPRDTASARPRGAPAGRTSGRP